MMNRLPASSSSGSTVASSSPPRTLSKTGYETSSTTGPTSAGLVLDCEGINFIDSQGSAKLAEIARLANESSITVRLARLKPIVAGTLERDGVLERIGIDQSTATCTEQSRHKMPASATDRSKRAAEAPDCPAADACLRPPCRPGPNLGSPQRISL